MLEGKTYIDKAYTLKGCLKGVNSTTLNSTFDIGGDGTSGSLVPKDVFGFGIHYYGNKDYTPINSSVKPFVAAVGNKPLFNGNISAISQSISSISTPLEYTYSYDVLNHIKCMTANKGLDTVTNSWTNAFTALPDFQENISYDGNGNILKYKRNGNNSFAGSQLVMDSMTYNYRPGTNKLTYVKDTVNWGRYGNDIDNQGYDNYKYDSIGNIVSDRRAGVDSIRWNVYGKISKIFKHDRTAAITSVSKMLSVLTQGKKVISEEIVGTTALSYYGTAPLTKTKEVVEDGKTVIKVYEKTEIGIAKTIIHEAIHTMIGTHKHGDDLPHDYYSQYQAMLLSALKEYNQENKLGYTDEQLTQLSWTGIIESKAFKKYITDLSVKNNTTYKEEYSKWYKGQEAVNYKEVTKSAEQTEKKDEKKSETDASTSK
ncbi:hypothetical protein DXN04_33570 [Chitinophaga silvisoli]|uniref:RHS repeat-associated core domain-containing protein n=1 Tax=Chitinophaga silvisoli TaxID=2291814 RepID=A0A3E1NN06_9BACT|nr:hypothetical protein DXN04_33570 [Chitinophaga silvisoli]